MHVKGLKPEWGGFFNSKTPINQRSVENPLPPLILHNYGSRKLAPLLDILKLLEESIIRTLMVMAAKPIDDHYSVNNTEQYGNAPVQRNGKGAKRPYLTDEKWSQLATLSISICVACSTHDGMYLPIPFSVKFVCKNQSFHIPTFFQKRQKSIRVIMFIFLFRRSRALSSKKVAIFAYSLCKLGHTGMYVRGGEQVLLGISTRLSRGQERTWCNSDDSGVRIQPPPPPPSCF